MGFHLLVFWYWTSSGPRVGRAGQCLGKGHCGHPTKATDHTVLGAHAIEERIQSESYRTDTLTPKLKTESEAGNIAFEM